MADKKKLPKLKAQKRKILGRKVKKIRREGILPANLYGKKVKSQSLQVDLKNFWSVYEGAGETGVVDLIIENETKTRPVLIHNVQNDPVSDRPLHVDFFQVSLKEKVTTEIPIELVGESSAVKDKVGILVQQLSEVEVEALPTDLPDKFSVDIGKLKEVDDSFIVADLKVAKGVKILASKKQIVVKIEPPTKEEAPIEKEEEEPVEGEVEAGESEESVQEPGEDQAQEEKGPASEPGKGEPPKHSPSPKKT
ncbi:50S ribosomal protein L25 [Patescibacteria group bacterium]